jgi:Na+/serine symporter
MMIFALVLYLIGFYMQKIYECLAESTFLDPKNIILNWAKQNLSKVPKSIKKTLKPITLVGMQNEIFYLVPYNSLFFKTIAP